MSFTDSIKTCFSKFATFSGRATRAEYWWFTLFFLVCIILMTVALESDALDVIVLILCWFALMIPALSVSVRRLHDTGRSGWFLIWGLVPIVGDIILLIVCLEESGPDNEYGSKPDNVSIINDKKSEV